MFPFYFVPDLQLIQFHLLASILLYHSFSHPDDLDLFVFALLLFTLCSNALLLFTEDRNASERHGGVRSHDGLPAGGCLPGILYNRR